MTNAVEAAAFLLMFVVLPAWVLAGLVDYFCHRAARIQDNAGWTESLLHLLQLGTVGIAVLAGLFLAIDAGVLALMLACIAAHHLIAYIDIAYANHRRRVTPFEQMVHSVLEIAPITALLLLAVLYWPQFLSLFGAGRADFAFRPRPAPLPPLYVAGLLTATLLLNLLPYVEELVRSLRGKPQSQSR